jgi:hypothetical protein
MPVMTMRPMLTRLLDPLQDELLAAGVDLQPPLQAVQVSGADGPARKRNLLVFGHGCAEPSLVLKFVRDQGYQQQLEQEYATLQTLNERPELQGTVPQPVGLFFYQGQMILAERFLPGTPLAVFLTQRRHRRPAAAEAQLQWATSWLRRFQTEGGQRSSFGGGPTIEERVARWSGARLAPSFVKEFLSRAYDYAGLPLPLVASHGDYWAGNLLIRQKSGVIQEVAVNDWEDFALARWPFHDLFLFLTTYVEQYPLTLWRRGDRDDRYQRGLLSDNWLAQLAVATMQEAFRGYGLPVETLPLFYPLFLLQMATPAAEDGEKRRQQAGPWQERLRQYGLAAASGRIWRWGEAGGS